MVRFAPGSVSKLDLAGMVLMCLGCVVAALLVLSFTPNGLAWWYSIEWAVSLGPFLMALPVACLALFVFGATASIWLELDFGALLIAMILTVVLVLVATLFSASVVRSDQVNIGWMSLDRAHRLKNVIDNRSILQVEDAPSVSDEITLIEKSLDNPTHANLKEAYALVSRSIVGDDFTRAMDAALILGLSKEPAVQFSRFRGWMRPAELDQLRSAARKRAESEVSNWNGLQQSAFLALTQPDGLHYPLKLSGDRK